jgi:hypothetical protein
MHVDILYIHIQRNLILRSQRLICYPVHYQACSTLYRVRDLQTSTCRSPSGTRPYFARGRASLRRPWSLHHLDIVHELRASVGDLIISSSLIFTHLITPTRCFEVYVLARDICMSSQNSFVASNGQYSPSFVRAKCQLT